MFTYIINTSENKTFDSDGLFKLVGYHRLKWIECSLANIEMAANDIRINQTALDAEEFQIAVIVDFFNFDRVRKPYGYDGNYSAKSGKESVYIPEGDENKNNEVDISVYFPFIESYLIDHLFNYLEKKEIPPVRADIFYVQASKEERFDISHQTLPVLKTLVSPSSDSIKKDVSYHTIGKLKINGIEYYLKDHDSKTLINNVLREQLKDTKDEYEVEKLDMQVGADAYFEMVQKLIGRNAKLGATLADEIISHDIGVKTTNDINEESKKYSKANDENNNDELVEHHPNSGKFKVSVKEESYSQFQLYCSNKLSLIFKTTDYPYYGNSDELTLKEFLHAFIIRNNAQKELIDRKFNTHHYYTGLAVNKISAAYDVLSLSLYLIKQYERGTAIDAINNDEVSRLNQTLLKECLERSWNKIKVAKEAAQTNDITYYDIVEISRSVFDKAPSYSGNETAEINRCIAIEKEKNKRLISSLSVEEKYEQIKKIASSKMTELNEKQQQEVDTVVAEYLDKRDETRNGDDSIADIDVSTIISNHFVGTNSNKNRDAEIPQKKQCPTIEELNTAISLKETHLSEHMASIFHSGFLAISYEEEKQKSYQAYRDYVESKALLKKSFLKDLIFAIITMIVIMVPYIAISAAGKIFEKEFIAHYFLCSGIFFGVFVLSVLLINLPIIRKLQRAKKEINRMFTRCLGKQEYSISAIKRMYKTELIYVEKGKYQIEEIKRLQDDNIRKNRHADMHRKLLVEIENKLATLLNNLGVQPSVDNRIGVSGEFDITKPFDSPENKIYKIFSIDVIESLFDKNE